jgi:hypothetical protein
MQECEWKTTYDSRCQMPETKNAKTLNWAEIQGGKEARRGIERNGRNRTGQVNE